MGCKHPVCEAVAPDINGRAAVRLQECDQVLGRNRTVLLAFGKDEPAGILFKRHEELSLQKPSLRAASKLCHSKWRQKRAGKKIISNVAGGHSGILIRREGARFN